MNKYVKIAIIFVTAVFFAIGLFAQEATEENKGSPLEGGASEAKIVETSPGNVTMDFKDADINNVLRILSYKSGLNIVAGKDVTGLVTIRLTDVPWEKALDVILRTYGYTYERDGNIIRVITAESVQKEELITETFLLRYAKAKDMPEALKEMISDRGKIKYDERTNTLVITDIPTNLYKIRQVIETLDRRTPQVNIEAKIIETTLDKDDNLGIRWTMQVTATGAKAPSTLPFTAQPKGGEIFPRGDESASAGTSIGKFAPGVGRGFPMALPSNFTLGTLDFSSFQAVLQILASKVDTKLISNPRITTLNNQEAKIVVASTFNIPTYELNETTGNYNVTGYEEKDVGVILTVTPHVNPDGYIVVDLRPEVTAFLQWDTIGTLTVPRFSTREATTQVMVKDGQTIVIGGLIKETVSDTVYKVPILGDIPIVGWLLFRKKEKAIDKTDLLFFITVNLVDAEKQENVAGK